MTIPRVLELHQTAEGLRLYNKPVKELKSLRTKSATLSTGDLSTGKNILDQFDMTDGLYELEIEFENIDSGFVEFQLGGEGQDLLSFGYNADQNVYFVDRTFAGNSSFSEYFAGLHQTTPLEYDVQTRTMQVFIDHSSIEIFADGGRTVLTEIFFPNSRYNKITLNSGKSDWFISGSIHQLSSIW